MDRELLAHFLRAPYEREQHPRLAGLFMTRLAERLSECPAAVFSRCGEVLAQTRPAIALFGDYTGGRASRFLVDRWFTDPAARERYLVEVGATGHRDLKRYRHAELGELELYRQLLVEPEEQDLLLVLTAVPGSATDAKIAAAVGRLTH